MRSLGAQDQTRRTAIGNGIYLLQKRETPPMMERLQMSYNSSFLRNVHPQVQNRTYQGRNSIQMMNPSSLHLKALSQESFILQHTDLHHPYHLMNLNGWMGMKSKTLMTSMITPQQTPESTLRTPLWPIIQRTTSQQAGKLLNSQQGKAGLHLLQ